MPPSSSHLGEDNHLALLTEMKKTIRTKEATIIADIAGLNGTAK